MCLEKNNTTQCSKRRCASFTLSLKASEFPVCVMCVLGQSRYLGSPELNLKSITGWFFFSSWVSKICERLTSRTWTITIFFFIFHMLALQDGNRSSWKRGSWGYSSAHSGPSPACPGTLLLPPSSSGAFGGSFSGSCSER